MFHHTLLDPQLSSLFSTSFPTLAPGSSTSPSLLYPSMSPSTPFLQGGLCCGRLAEQSPLTGYEPKSLIEVSSEHPPVILPSRRGSLDTNVDDLVTTQDASEVCDTTDVGRFTSTLFSQEREVSAVAFSVSWSQTHSSIEKSRRDVEPFSSFGKSLSKGEEIENWRVCGILKWKGKEFCLNKEIFMTSLKGTLIMLFMENAQLRQDYLKRSLNWTWRVQNAVIALYDTGMQLQSQGMEPYQAIQLTRLEGRRAGYVTN